MAMVGAASPPAVLVPHRHCRFLSFKKPSYSSIGRRELQRIVAAKAAPAYKRNDFDTVNIAEDVTQVIFSHLP